MQKLFKRSLAMVLALMMVITMFSGVITVSAEEAVAETVDVSFHTCDETTNTVNFSGNRAGESITGKTGNAIKFTKSKDGVEELNIGIWRASGNGIAAKGVTAVKFDLFLSDGMSLNDGWGNLSVQTTKTNGGDTNLASATQANAKVAMKTYLADVTTGWNTVTIPVDPDDDQTIEQVCLRFYSLFTGSASDYIAIDNVVLVKEAYTKSAVSGTQLYHMASLAAADLSAPNAIDMQYLAQEFVPTTSTICGAKLNFNLTSGSAVVHVELRKDTPTAAAFFSTEVEVTSVGDVNNHFYTLNFGENVSVAPGSTYYLCFWFVSKSSDGIVAIACGGDTEGHDLYRHKRFDSAGTLYTAEEAPLKATGKAVGFEILSTEGQTLQLRSCDDTGWQNTPRGDFYKDTENYVEGTGSILVDLDHRSGTKVMNAWLGSIDGRTADTDTLDITSLYNENGEFYLAFDLWADPEFLNSGDSYKVYKDENGKDVYSGDFDKTVQGGLNAGRLVVGLITRASDNANGSYDKDLGNAKESIEIDKVKGTDWSIWGLENGLQPGWNHLAIKITDNAEGTSYMKAGRETYWDPTAIWGIKFNYQQLNWQDPNGTNGTVQIRLDDIRFMTVEAYEATAASENKIKDAIGAINEVENIKDAEGIAAAKAALAKLSANELAQVTNLEKFDEITLVVDQSLYSVEGVDCGMGWIMVPAGPQENTPYATTPTPWTENYTEGTGAGKVQWANGDTPKMHLSIMGVDKYWDLSKANYITMDLYVHGWSVKKTGDTDFNFGFGSKNDPASWGNQDLGWIGKDNLWNAGISTLKEGWNHLVLPIASGAKKDGVGNMRLFFENSVVFSDAVVAGTDKAYAIIDDIRAVNNNGLLNVQDRNVAKPVISAIAGANTVETVAAARAAYTALGDDYKAYVTNLSVLEAKEAAVEVADAFEAKVAEMGEVTYADKDAVAALVEEYNAMGDDVKLYVDTTGLNVLVETINAEQAALDDVYAKIDAIPTLDELELADEAVVEIARESYDALADDTKAAVTVSATDVLVAAEEKIQELIDAASDDIRAAAMEKAIAKLPYAEEVTLADAELINRVADKYNALPEGAKALVSEFSFKKLYSVVVMLDALEADATAAAEVDALIAELPADITLENKDAVYAVRDAYAALNENAKLSVEGKDALANAVAAMDKLVADDAAAAELTAAINALTDDSSKAEKQAVIDLYNAASAEAIALLDAETSVKYNKMLLANTAYDITFRTFDQTRLNDLNVEDIGAGVWNAGQKSDIPVLGDRYFWVESLKDTNRLFLYVYGHKQNEFVDANGNNAEGTVRLVVGDVEDMYITFDFYVSDADVLKATNDAGFGIDTKEGGGSSQWGNTLKVKSSDVKDMIKELEDGWNHVVLPLEWANKAKGEKFEGTAIRLESFRFYINNITIPTGFVAGMDDIHFVNGLALATSDAQRAIAAGITDDIRNYPADATADDFYAIYVAYNSLDAEYQALVKGWDAFIEANTALVTPSDVKLAEDNAVATSVEEAIAALDKDITVADEQAIADAEEAYAGLNDNQKLLVGNAYILTNAKAALEAAKVKAADEAAAAPVIEMIEALPETVSDTDVTNTDIAAAREAYDALTDAQKAIVGDLLAKLEAAEANLVIAIDMAAAGEVEAMIDALPTPTDITVSDTDVVNAAVEAYGKLTNAQKAYLSAAAAEKLAACVEALNNIPDVPEVNMGDVDGDGKVNAKDALLALRMAVGKYDATDAEKLAADVDEDGKVDAKDALEMLKFAVGKPSKLDKFYPVEA